MRVPKTLTINETLYGQKQNFHRFSKEGPKTHRGFGDLTLKLINLVGICPTEEKTVKLFLRKHLKRNFACVACQCLRKTRRILLN